MGSAPGIQSYVEFEADFPDEEELLGDDDETPVGRPIAEHLRACLEAEQVLVSEVYPHSSYGWAFEVRFGRVTVWCMLQGSDVWLLITEVPGRWIDRVFGQSPDAKHQRVVDVLQRVLARAPFRHAKWNTEAGYRTSERSVRGCAHVDVLVDYERPHGTLRGVAVATLRATDDASRSTMTLRNARCRECGAPLTKRSLGARAKAGGDCFDERFEWA